MLAMSKRLGHSSVSITGDLYSHAVEQVDREAADRTAAFLLPRVSHPGLPPATAGGSLQICRATALRCS